MESINYTNKVCSFTGYRTQKLNACLAHGSLTLADIEAVLKREMLSMLDRGFNKFLSGMAIGADMMFARLALELRDEYSSMLVKFVSVVPCLEHDNGWNLNDRLLCRRIIAEADENVLVSNTHYFKGCMAKRNRYLVDRCDELLAVYDGQHGGTMQTINYAKGLGRKITMIDPSKKALITLRESYEKIQRFDEL
jgi:uncharacterized phage-like protein YoqJ